MALWTDFQFRICSKYQNILHILQYPEYFDQAIFKLLFNITSVEMNIVDGV